MSPLGPEYRSFLLRLWLLPQASQPAWRLVLVSTRSGQEWHFADFDSLVRFLSEQAEAGEPGPADE